jgi:Protein of unknown function (DUF3179)
MTSLERKSTLLWVAFTLLLCGMVVLFFGPAFVIRPFRYQSPGALAWAIRLRHYAPIGTAALAVPLLVIAGRLWPQTKRWSKAGLVVGLLLAGLCSTMARMNYFEWMFHPIARPGFEKAEDAKLDTNEMVLTVSFAGDARAYPIREMAYHHIVNDVVGEVPVAVTY